MFFFIWKPIYLHLYISISISIYTYILSILYIHTYIYLLYTYIDTSYIYSLYSMYINIYVYTYIYKKTYIYSNCGICSMINKNIPISDILWKYKQTAMKYTSNVYNVKHCIHQSISALNSKNKGSTLFRPKIFLGFCVESILHI